MRFNEQSVAILAPGQGSHYPGMGEEQYGRSEIVKSIFHTGSEVTGVDLREVCFGSETDRLDETLIAQPAIAAVSLANYALLHERGISVDAGKGHSVGEISALGAGGSLSMGQTFGLIKARAEITHAAAQDRPGRMAVIKNLKKEEIFEALGDLIKSGRLSIPNFNTTFQHVMSGDTELIAAARERIKKIDITDKLRGKPGVLRLAIEGAFHSQYHMEKAVEPFYEAAQRINFKEPGFYIMLNNARYVHEIGTDNLAGYLANQLINGVDFVGGTGRLYEDGMRRFVDIGPKPIHAPMVKQEHPDVEALTVDDLLFPTGTVSET